jgi:hypothetical protein
MQSAYVQAVQSINPEAEMTPQEAVAGVLAKRGPLCPLKSAKLEPRASSASRTLSGLTV